jgi:hypothetical protein
MAHASGAPVQRNRIILLGAMERTIWVLLVAAGLSGLAAACHSQSAQLARAGQGAHVGGRRHGRRDLEGGSTPPPPEVSWVADREKDPLTQKSRTVWTLYGHYLVPPQDRKLLPPIIAGGAPIEDSPAIILRCHAGRLAAAYVISGATMLRPTADGYGDDSDIAVKYRLGAGPLRSATWERSTDYQAAFFDARTAARILRAKAAIIGLPEYDAGEIEIRFSIPKSAAVARSCGLRPGQLQHARLLAEQARAAMASAEANANRAAEIGIVTGLCGPAIGKKLASAPKAQFEAMASRYRDNCGRE